MFKKISLLAVTAAAVALALTSCVKAPVSGLLDTKGLDGSWSFAPRPVMAVIDGTSVTVTVGDGTMALGQGNELASVTKIVVTSTLTEDAEEMTFTLMLAGDDPIMVTLAGVPPALEPAVSTAAKGVIKGMIKAAQDGTVMIDLDSDADPDVMTVSGSFIGALLAAAGEQPPPTSLMATRIIE